MHNFVLRNHILLALPRRDVVDVHPVNLLEAPATAFDNAEIGDEDAEEDTAGEHIAVSKVNLISDEGREESNEEIPEPVGGNGQGHALCTVLGGEKFDANRPGHRTPCHGKAFYNARQF